MAQAGGHFGASSKEGASGAGVKRKSIGGVAVGCILFAADADIAKKPDEFFEELKAELSSVENITELRFSGIDAAYLRHEYVRDPFDKEVVFYPHVIDSSIYFKLFIPFKVQDDLGFRCEVETFEIYTIFHFRHAVTYVPYSGDGGGAWGPSTALALIREYLKAKLWEGIFKVSVVAPSPFHADFRAVPRQTNSQVEDVTTTDGYRIYEYGFDEKGGDYLHPFVQMYGESLGLYYHLEKMDNNAYNFQLEIAKCVDKLLTNQISILARFHTSKGIRAQIDEINRNVLAAKNEKKTILNTLEREEGGVDPRYLNDLEYHFRRIRRQAAESDYSDALSIAALYEARNHSFIQNTAVIIAGLFGGLLGALITSFLAG